MSIVFAGVFWFQAEICQKLTSCLAWRSELPTARCCQHLPELNVSVDSIASLMQEKVAHRTCTRIESQFAFQWGQRNLRSEEQLPKGLAFDILFVR
jgi:hypothetical protein